MHVDNFNYVQIFITKLMQKKYFVSENLYEIGFLIFYLCQQHVTRKKNKARALL